MLDAQAKQAVMAQFQRKEGDTGSSEVQIALLTARIRGLQDHFSANKKDKHSRHGLMKMVSTRRKLLRYVKNTNIDLYRQLLEKLEIRG